MQGYYSGTAPTGLSRRIRPGLMLSPYRFCSCYSNTMFGKPFIASCFCARSARGYSAVMAWRSRGRQAPGSPLALAGTDCQQFVPDDLPRFRGQLAVHLIGQGPDLLPDVVLVCRQGPGDCVTHNRGQTVHRRSGSQFRSMRIVPGHGRVTMSNNGFHHGQGRIGVPAH